MDSENFMFGLTQLEFESIALKVCLTGLILFMLFIIGNLARESKAGKYGTLWLFAALGVGFIGFVAKSLIQKFMGIE